MTPTKETTYKNYPLCTKWRVPWPSRGKTGCHTWGEENLGVNYYEV